MSLLPPRHVLLSGGSVRAVYELPSEAASGYLSPTQNIRLSTPVWEMVPEPSKFENGWTVTSVSRSLGRCAIFSGRYIDILESSLSCPTFIYNTISHVVYPRFRRGRMINVAANWRTLQGGEFGLPYKGGLEVTNFSLVDHANIINRNEGVEHISLHKMPKILLPRHKMEYITADEEGARICIGMLEERSLVSALVVVDI